MADQGCINLGAAHALLAGLIQGGMRDLVLSPGARSTPLVLAAQRHADLRLFPILDERSAAFFALGLARAACRPVGVLCTSGSALAHWYPAVIEADCSGVPLILLSADRPPELRGWGANQTIDQTRFFGVHVRAFYDPGPPDDSPAMGKHLLALGRRAAAECQGPDPGPVHLNLPFREPLVPGPDCRPSPRVRSAQPTQHWPDGAGAQASPPRIAQGARPDPLIGDGIHLDLDELARLGRRGLICCGPGDWTDEGAAALWRLAERLKLPVLCDPLSGLRFGPGSEARIARYDALLRCPALAQGLRPDWAIRFGRTPVSKGLIDWLTGVPSLLVEPGRRFSDPTHDVLLKIQADPARFCALALAEDPWSIQADAGWLESWIEAERRIERLMADYLAQSPWCEGHLVQTLIARLPEGEGLLCANSLPIRQLDLWSGSRRLPLRVFGNRGASGIDGQSSTLAGLNAGGVPTTGLLGDLSLWHDLSGLLQLRDCPRPCIVINNGGGRIFDMLPQRDLPGLERFWRCPIPLDLGPLAQAFGLSHWEVADSNGLDQALAAAQGVNGVLIEVRIDADSSLEVHRGLEALMQQLDT